MPSIAGPYFAFAALLGAAGLAKVVRPHSTVRALHRAGLPGTPLLGRLLGAAEVLTAAAALALGGREPALAVGLFYAGFAGFTFRLVRVAGSASCGCFGTGEAPASPIHVALNVVAATAAVLGAGWPVGSLPGVLADQPWAGVPFLVLVAVLAWLAYVSLTLLPDLSEAASAPASDRDPAAP